jgi:hypothetical protein
MNFRRIAAKVRPSTLFIVMIFAALIFFELFNYSTTEFALRDLLGNLNFLSIPWATILALAFCGIDFAGIARLLTPAQTKSEPKETWYLFGAWLIAATMNAALTWWGVSMAIVNHTEKSAAVVNQGTLLKVVPLFVAILVWVIRVLIIGSISYTFERLTNKNRQATQNVVVPMRSSSTSLNGSVNHAPSRPVGFQSAVLRPNSMIGRPAPKPVENDPESE